MECRGIKWEVMGQKDQHRSSQASGAAERSDVPSDGSSPSFRGNFEHTLDEKGRVSVPVEFRQTILAAETPTVVLTNFICDGARCIEAALSTEWAIFEKKLRARSRFDPQLRKLENYYLSRASVCALDSSGRINIPPHLRTYAGLTRDVIFTSSLHGFRLWDKRVWDLVFSEAEAALLENPALFLDVDA